MSIIPFDPPRLLTAECKAGFVNVSPASYRSDSGRGWDTSGSTTEHFEGDPAERTDSPTPEPTSLQRTQTMSGNILTITGHPNHNDDTSPEAFWLQRKLGKFHSDGMIRMGYRLRGSGVRWELWKDRGEDHHTMVKVHIMPGSVLDENNNGANADVCSPVNELSALQMIASHNTNEPKHVLGTRLIATSAQDVYVILPYHQDGTLMQFCQTVGNLPEPLARFLFRQIIKVWWIVDNLFKLHYFRHWMVSPYICPFLRHYRASKHCRTRACVIAISPSMQLRWTVITWTFVNWVGCFDLIGIHQSMKTVPCLHQGAWIPISSLRNILEPFAANGTDSAQICGPVG
jgi:hypothetical protein